MKKFAEFLNNVSFDTVFLAYAALYSSCKKFFKETEEMKIENITDIDGFFEVVSECKGSVELVSGEGDRINLKSKLAQIVAMANLFSNGYIRELDLVISEPEDVNRLLKYIIRS